MLHRLDHVYRLRPWTIREYKGAFYITQEDHPKKWGRKYGTLQRACTAIARLMQKEWEQRASFYARNR